MKFDLLAELLLLLLLVTGTLTQDGFDLSDALDDVDPTPAKPKEQPKVPAKPKDDELDLFEALGPDEPKKPNKPKPKPGGSDGFGFDLEDAVHPDPNEKPDKPAIDTPKRGGGGGGGSFDDKDLFDLGGGDYKPDRGGRADQPHGGGGSDQPQDPDLLWGQVLKMLIANMPEEFFLWMSNIRQTLERILELMQTVA
uniref:CD99 molecule isoform X3 n=1 Tax=Doryrhamphus excisus TaxID=161450 RepID=UPI0025AEA6A9|nr:CD99 molecule isoform X3 [Doryrhamphus excisus]